jgi:hypothetical protein
VSVNGIDIFLLESQMEAWQSGEGDEKVSVNGIDIFLLESQMEAKREKVSVKWY